MTEKPCAVCRINPANAPGNMCTKCANASMTAVTKPPSVRCVAWPEICSQPSCLAHEQPPSVMLTEGNWKRPMWSINWLEVPAEGPWARLQGHGCEPDGIPMLIVECEKHDDWLPVDNRPGGGAS